MPSLSKAQKESWRRSEHVRQNYIHFFFSFLHGSYIFNIFTHVEKTIHTYI